MHTRTFTILLSTLTFLFSPTIALVVEKRGLTSFFKPKPAPEILTFKYGVRPDAEWTRVNSKPMNVNFNGDFIYVDKDPKGNERVSIKFDNKNDKVDYIFYDKDGFQVGSGKRRDGKLTYSTKPYDGAYAGHDLIGP